MRKQDDNLYCGDDREDELSDMYYAEDENFYISLDEIDFELEEKGDLDETSD